MVFEANAYPGGKLTSVEKAGFRWDAGPSLFTMPHLVDELFELFDESERPAFSYTRKSTVCNYFWEDGTQFTAHADKAAFASEAASVFDVGEEEVTDYLGKAREKHDLVSPVFLERSLHDWRNYMSIATMKGVIGYRKLQVNKSLHEVNNQTFKDPRLVQLFDRYATYNGSSPYKTPGIMSLIPHYEMHYGCFYPKGGMHSITTALVELAENVGVRFHYGQRVSKIKQTDGKVFGIELNGTFLKSDVVVCNADVYTAYHNLLPDLKKPKRVLSQERSSSALIFYWGVEGSFDQLDLHNIFFSADYKNEFSQLFDHKTISDDPTVYVNITSKEEPEHAPEGCENWFVMVNVPGNDGQHWPELIAQTRSRVLNKLSRVLGKDVSSLIRTEEVLDPIDIESRTSSHQGSLYGTSSNSQFAAFLRHSNASREIKGLHFCGGSVHPGGGIPLCLLSARIATNNIPVVNA